MQIDIKAKNIELTDAIKAYVEEKVGSLEGKTSRFGDVVRAEVEVGKTSTHHKKGQLFRAEVHVRLPGTLIYADSEHEDLYAAINAARKEAERQIVAYKDSLDAGSKKGAGK